MGRKEYIGRGQCLLCGLLGESEGQGAAAPIGFVGRNRSDNTGFDRIYYWLR
jgi:hypothetical protein